VALGAYGSFSLLLLFNGCGGFHGSRSGVNGNAPYFFQNKEPRSKHARHFQNLNPPVIFQHSPKLMTINYHNQLTPHNFKK
jgi:hypothetical protein